MDCATCVAKTVALISCTVTAQLICASGIAYSDYRFSYATVYMLIRGKGSTMSMILSLSYHKEENVDAIVLNCVCTPLPCTHLKLQK